MSTFFGAELCVTVLLTEVSCCYSDLFHISGFYHMICLLGGFVC